MNNITFKKDLLGVQDDLLRFAYKLTSDREEANDHFAVIVDEDIAHDGVYPSFEISIGRILLFVIQSFQGCFLQEVVGFFTVGGKLVRKA